MALSTRDVQRRISSVANTKKITKAMELVSASKMRKAVTRVLLSRAYSDAAWQTALHLAHKVRAPHHPLLVERPVRRLAVAVIGSNRGLCAGFNANAVAKCRQAQARQPEGTSIEYITFGKKMADGKV